MKKMTIIGTILCFGLLFSSCKKEKDTEDNLKTKGLI